MRIDVLVSDANLALNDDEDGYHVQVTLRVPVGVGAQILGGLIGQEVALDVDSTLATQPDPQVVKLVPGKKKKG